MTREELKQIYYINGEIKMWQKELDRLECKSLVKGQIISDMPRGNGTSDKVGDLAIERVEVGTVIQGKLAEIQIQRKKILDYISEVDDSLLRQIMYLRNVSCMTWGQVAKETNNSPDCVRKIYDRHFEKK